MRHLRPRLLIGLGFAGLASLALAQAPQIIHVAVDPSPGVAAEGGIEAEPARMQAVGTAISAQGVIESRSGGFKFPDGSVQASASLGSEILVQSLTANQGFYGNRIQLVTPPNPYSEICFKQGETSVDIHTGSSTTEGGFCEPGDLGWIIERNERPSQVWTVARFECLKDGMRLAEPFEWQFSCINSNTLALSNIKNDGEWASNSAFVERRDTFAGVATFVFGDGSCSTASLGVIGRNDGAWNGRTFRCVG